MPNLTSIVTLPIWTAIVGQWRSMRLVQSPGRRRTEPNRVTVLMLKIGDHPGNV